MTSLFSQFGDLSASNLSMLLLLAKATIILVAALGITLAMQRSSAGARHLVWLVTLGALMLVPAVASWIPLRIAVLPATAQSLESGNAAPVESTNRERVEGLAAQGDVSGAPVLQSSSATSTDSRIAQASHGVFGGFGWLSLLVGIWAAVVLCIAGSLVHASVVVRRIVRNARPLDSADWLTPLWEVSDRIGLDDPPRLLRSDEAKMPFACGVLNPAIVLPADCDGWSSDRRHAVLLHELAHIRRHDLAGHTLGRLACAVYWFHPLVWTAAKRLRSESERACDDLALECGARATDYAEHLLDIVTSVRHDATPSVALAMARRKEFEGRMLAILDPELRRSGPGRRQTFALIGSLAVVAVVVSAAAPAPRALQSKPAPVAPVATASTAAASEDDTHAPDDDDDSATAQFDEDTTDRIAKQVPTIPLSIEAKAEGVAVASSTREVLREQVNSQSIASAVVSPIVSPVVTSVVNGVTTALTRELLQAITGAAGTSSSLRKLGVGADDRPVLLANILRTDPNESLRRIAAWGLSEYADTRVGVDALAIAVRRDASAIVREMAAWALADAHDGDPGAVDALGAALKGDADVRVRATAAWALGNIGRQQSVDVLVAALADASPDVRRRAVWAIGSIEPREVPRQVFSLLSDADPRNRELAAWVLFQIEDPAAIKPLEAALARETNKDLQLDYIRALGAIGEKSVDALRGLLESPDPKTRSMAVRALAGGNATGPWPWPWPIPRPNP